ncbi:MAG: hypothetical protein M0P64_03625 [Candidatus Pacebacteria bacterium]|jgi:hypothetical protein|nr:hypothetical protein [Candidatus Paceibacterota bacterium]
MSKGNSALKQGKGDLNKEKEKKQIKEIPAIETIPARPCLMKKHDVWTSTPYGKTSNGNFLCCKLCSEEYYAIPNNLGVWGPPTSDMIRTSAEIKEMVSPEVSHPPILHVVK